MEITTTASMLWLLIGLNFLKLCVLFKGNYFCFLPPFFWQMARVVGGALPVRMFLHMFLIPTLVSVVSFFAYNASTSCIVLQFPAQEMWSVRHVLEVINKTSKLQGSTRHMHVVHQTDRVTDLYDFG